MSVLLIAYRRLLDCDASLRHLGVHGLLSAPSSHWCFPDELTEKDLADRLRQASQVIWAAPQLGRDGPWDSATASLLDKRVWDKTLILGARIHDGWDPGEVTLSRWRQAADKERVSVEAEADRERLLSFVGEANIYRVGPMSCWGEFPLLRREGHPRDVFVPPFYGAGQNPKKEQQLLAQWREKNSVLFLAQGADDFRWEPEVGTETFFSPRFPGHHGTAIRSAARVLSGRWDPVYLAVASGVPAVRLQIAENPGYRGSSPIPELALYDSTSVSNETEILHALLEDYPWKAIEEWIRSHRRERDRFLRKHRVRAFPRKSVQGTPMRFCSVVCRDTLASAMGWVENVQLHHPRAEFDLLALDPTVRQTLKAQWAEGVEVHGLEDLWTEQELAQVGERSLQQQGQASKGRLLLRALKHAVPCLFAEVNFHFYSSAQDLVKGLGKQTSALLLPRFDDRAPGPVRGGLFDGGLVLVSSGAEPFLKWWSGACLRGEGHPETYLDFAPLFFPEVGVHRQGNHAVAPWNQGTLALNLPPVPGSVPQVRGDRTVGAYHQAGPDLARVNEGKVGWDQLVTYFTSNVPLSQCGASWGALVFSLASYWPALERAVRWFSFRRFFQRDGLAPASLDKWSRGWRRALLERLLRSRSAPRTEAPGQRPWWIRHQQKIWRPPEQGKKKKKTTRKRQAA